MFLSLDFLCQYSETMEAKMAQSIKFSAWIGSEKMARKPNGLLHFSLRTREQNGLQIRHLQPTRTASCHKRLALKASCFHKNIPGSVLKSVSFPNSFDDASCDEALVLKNKSEEIEPNLNGRCIFLVGMMGSGKTTIGRILSEVLGYSFFDCDTLIEQAVGVTVAEIFKLHGESFFRDNEKLPLMKGQHVIIEGSGPVVTVGCQTETLRKLSSMQRLVVSTGGGAVIRPVNWRYMQRGISVWLDVPLEALARRIASVGTQSRPLLHQESGDAYEKALTRLAALLEERGEEYSNANTRVSLESVAAKHGEVDVCNLTPTVIATEALEQIESFLEKEGK